MRNLNKEVERKNWNRRTSHNLNRKDKRYNPHKADIKTSRVLGSEQIEAPIHLDLYNEENRELTLKFIKLIEAKAYERKVSLDFSNSESVSAAALLLLYATVDTLKQDPDARLVRLQNLKGKVKSTVECSGLRDLTLNKGSQPINCKNRTLPIIKGSAKGEEFEVVIDHVQHHVFDNEMTPEQENIWATAVIETVSNVKLHAYEGEESKPWWIICSIIGEELYLAICDRGVGIPNTIKDQNWITSLVEKTPRLQKLLSGTDADAIDLSMIVGETSTKAQKHGLGSKSIKALVDENPDGALWVFSNKGVYYRENQEAVLKNFGESISGTLVQWNIKLNYE
ncbi:hypothetical protein [Vibrio coralliilyticus]|uniref:hypothetical protein n=1 Tax=Vibrio coralliilyticus TaxID=190893 RepID=UPI00148B53E4|nr:hypothetical protein [Vibrio coralliilyticus]NOI32176.1 hypothetical protein [Vibrio coralliilyticus]NOI51358.1 hypothetical protein [Vibrio coralliilyticus]